MVHTVVLLTGSVISDDRLRLNLLTDVARNRSRPYGVL